MKKIFKIISIVNENYYSFVAIAFFLCLLPFIEIFSIGFFGILITRIFTEIGEFKLFNGFINLDSYSINSLFLIFTILYFVKTIILVILNSFIDYFSFNFVYLLKKKILNSLLNNNYQFFLKKKSADLSELINKLTGVFTINVVMSILKIFTNSLICIFIISFLYYINNKAVILVSIFGFVFMFFYVFLLKRLLYRYGRNTIDFSVNTTNIINEIIYGIKEILTLSLEKLFIKKAVDYSQLYSKSMFKSQFLSGLPRYIFEFFMVSFICVFFIFSKTNYEINIISMSMFLFASLRLLPSINIITKSFNDYNFGKFTTNKIYEILTESTIVKKKSLELNIDSLKKILLKGISFNYPNQKKITLKNLNFEIKKGQFVGIRGVSGSGKSTFLNILLTLLVANKGTFKINNFLFDASKIDKIDLTKFKNKISYSSQEPLILNETIKRNIILEKKFDIKFFNYVIKKCKLNFYNEKKSEKIGERGKKLSGGQKQKIFIARALYQEKDLIILDETTNSLDLRSENNILKTLNAVKKNKMILLVSHNNNTLKFCDKIYELKKNNLILIKET